MKRIHVVGGLGVALTLAVATWPPPGFEPTARGRGLSAWEDDLTYGRPDERIAAAREVAALARRAAVIEALRRDPVRAALASDDPATRGSVLRSLLGAPEALAPLISALEQLPHASQRDAFAALAGALAAELASGSPPTAASAGGETACGEESPDGMASDDSPGAPGIAARRAARDARCRFTLRLVERGDFGMREFWLLASRLTSHGIGVRVPSPPSNHGNLLADPDPRVRREAAVAILRMGPEARATAEKVVQREKPAVRTVALRELAEARAHLPAFDLDAALAPLDAHALERLFAGAARTGASAAPLLERALADERVEVRRWAAWSARELAPSLGMASWLAPHAHDPDDDVRRFTLVAAARAADAEAARLGLLRAGLGDPAIAVRHAATAELVRLGEPGCATLAGALARDDSDGDDTLARVLAGSRAPLPTTAACAELVAALVRVLPRASPATSGAIQTAIARGAAPDALTLLLGDADPSVRLRALGVLGQQRGRDDAERARIAASLAGLLPDPDPLVRRAALAALTRLGGDALRSVAEPIGALARGDADVRVRARAERALARLAGAPRS
ncbi:MAG: HEAT repeat domain-containing protein [bacterium]